MYAKSWRVICLPLVTWLSCFSCAVLLVYYSAIFGSPKNFREAFWAFDQFYRFENVLYASNIITNVYATCTTAPPFLLFYLGISQSGLISGNHLPDFYSRKREFQQFSASPPCLPHPRGIWDFVHAYKRSCLGGKRS